MGVEPYKTQATYTNLSQQGDRVYQHSVRISTDTVLILSESMNSNGRDVSLYELALASEQAPYPLQVSPATFKSMLEALMDVLIHQDVAATILMKLPRGQLWQGVIDRYCSSVSSMPTVYVLKNYRSASSDPSWVHQAAQQEREQGGEPEQEQEREQDSLASASAVASAAVATDPSLHETSTPIASLDPATFTDVDDDMPELASLERSMEIIELTLASDSRLRREYFVLVITPTFRALILAHRPRSAQQLSPDPTAAGQKVEFHSRSNALTDEEGDRRHLLLSLCSFDVQTIEVVMGGLHQAIELGHQDTGLDPQDSPILGHWDDLTQQISNASLDPRLLGQFWEYQIQHYEELWSKTSEVRKQAETASTLQLENEELLNEVRLKNEFLKTVGQELRTPLSTMKTALSLIGSPNLKVPQRQRYMDLLSRECDRQSALITSVLELIQLENAENQSSMQPLRVVDIVPSVVSTYQPLAQEKGILLAYNISDELPAVSCLSSWLRQVVINLLHNGIKFTSSGGKVWVRSRRQGDYVQLEFRDTGIGIPLSDIPKIFDRFYRVRQSAIDDPGGAGLGLSIVQQILLRCGGSISVQSRQGEGTVFNVLLPIYHPERQAKP